MPAESDLHKALAAVGESAPERPDFLDAPNRLAFAGTVYIDAIDAIALRLAVRLERAERCRVCGGAGQEWKLVGHDEYGNARGDAVECAACHGTGKEQGR